jgi:RNA-directed DNA polymerase
MRMTSSSIARVRGKSSGCDVMERRLAQCKLELHPEKTKVVYCKDGDRGGHYPDEKFDFLGFTFRPRLAKFREGKYGVSFNPAVSAKA